MQYVQKHSSHTEKEDSEKAFEKRKAERAGKRKIKIAIGLLILIAAAAAIAYWALSPGKYDNFAKCLAEKGAVMYGEDWCPYTNAQKAMFGKSFKYINYQVKTGLRVRPTWIINESRYETVQSFQRLSELTGCKY